MAITLVEALGKAREQLAQATGLKPVAVVGSFKDGEGWHISVDMLELARIPDSTDILGTYKATLDEGGNLLKFERSMTRLRGQPIESEEE